MNRTEGPQGVKRKLPKQELKEKKTTTMIKATTRATPGMGKI